MTKLIWDSPGSKLYERGIDRGVFYDMTGGSEVWNGLISVNETQSSVSETVSFIDGNRYINSFASSNFSANLTALTYPQKFEEHIGYLDNGFTNQGNKPFNLSYRTLVGNDTEGLEHGYKIHLIYNAQAVESTTDFVSFSPSMEPTYFSWNIVTVPEKIFGLKPSSHIIIDSRKTNETVLPIVEDILYGNNIDEPRFPSIDELITIFQENSLFQIIDHGDGSFTAIGSDEYVSLLEPTVFQLSSPSVYLLDEETYEASTL